MALFKPHAPSYPLLLCPPRRIDELTAELENLKRLSAQKQQQDKVCRHCRRIHFAPRVNFDWMRQERVKVLKTNLKKSDEELQEHAAVICHCRWAA